MDHCIPCASFDLTKEENIKKCFHFTNLQPLWSKDNISKSDYILDEFKDFSWNSDDESWEFK